MILLPSVKKHTARYTVHISNYFEVIHIVRYIHCSYFFSTSLLMHNSFDAKLHSA
jgi:hypothetical protein